MRPHFLGSFLTNIPNETKKEVSDRMVPQVCSLLIPRICGCVTLHGQEQADGMKEGRVADGMPLLRG